MVDERALSDDEDYMDEDYSFPDNFDDFQEDPAPQPPASSLPSQSKTSAVRPQRIESNQFPAGASATNTTAGTATRMPLPSSGSSRNTTPHKSSLGRGDSTQDNSSEFRGPYQHSKEMFKVFKQVQYMYIIGVKIRTG